MVKHTGRLIGNQVYHNYDTVRCVSISGNIYEGYFIGEIGENLGVRDFFDANNEFIKVIHDGKIQHFHEFRYVSINPLRKVLIEKSAYENIECWNSISTNAFQEHKFKAELKEK